MGLDECHRFLTDLGIARADLRRLLAGPGLASTEKTGSHGVVLDERIAGVEIVRVELHGALEFSARLPGQ